MEKKRLIGLYVFSSVVIAWSVLGMSMIPKIIEQPEIYAPNPIFKLIGITLPFILLGIVLFLLLRKNWARRALLVITVLEFCYFIIGTINRFAGTPYPTMRSFAHDLLFTLIQLFYYLILVYYFTRSEVREQFKWENPA